jgi:uncharacterized membrane-anchored protein
MVYRLSGTDRRSGEAIYYNAYVLGRNGRFALLSHDGKRSTAFIYEEILPCELGAVCIETGGKTER